MDIRIYLDDLEKRLDEAEEKELYRQWESFYDGKSEAELFCPSRSKKSPPSVEWPSIPINDAIENMDLMLIKELKKTSDALANGSGVVAEIRANYGTCIVPAFFGVELFIMDRDKDTLPTNLHIEGGLEGIEKLIAKGIPDLNKSYGAKVFEFGRYYLDIIKDYPNIKANIMMTHPDAQGPFDICELICGSEIFLWLYDCPDMLKKLLDLVTETYSLFMKKHFELFPQTTRLSSHWGMYVDGKIMLRDDSAMNLSPEMFDEFIGPYDEKLLLEFGGGAIHFCGKGDHFISRMGKLRNLTAIAMSQPHLNDMEEIWKATVDQGIRHIGFDRKTAQETLKIRPLHRKVHTN